MLKLNRLGISGNLWLWFKFYLLHYQQCVKINNQFSDFLPVLSGILQCSILGPLLFLVCINDLPDHVLTSILLLFADDTKCFKTITDINDSPDLQKDVDNIDGWSINSDLLFSLSKILFMSFKLKPHLQTSIIISSDLDWEPHHQHIISKAYQMLGLLRRSFSTNKTAISKKHLYNITSQISIVTLFWKTIHLDTCKICGNSQMKISVIFFKLTFFCIF